MTRRTFLQTTALAGLAASLPAADQPRAFPSREGPGVGLSATRLRKGIMYATVGIKGSVLEKFQAIKAAGFAGVEVMSHMDQTEVLHARDATGLEIPSVCGQHHWAKPLTDPNPATREFGVEALKQCLRDAKAYGAKSVLLVPGVVNQNIPYDVAYQRAQQEIRKAIPLAEELGVKISIENVWNNFLLSPLEAARFVDEFKSPAVGWHFDIGNVLRYGWPEQWIRTLGKRIQMLHIKEYSLKKMNEEGLGKGFQVKFLEGDNNWPGIMKALTEIGYRGWGIAEQPGGNTPEGLQDLSARMDKIFAS
ncbi:MAG: sugar phosphate isomerase/epimerase family protein [Verrucomicrobiota bacterium]